MAFIPTESETDLELLITAAESGFFIEVYVPGDPLRDLSADKERLSQIRLQLQKDFGVSRIGSATLTLKNDDHRYSTNHASSIFYDKQVVRDWVRIQSGWGSQYANEVTVQFQGRIKKLTTTEGRRAIFQCYDGLNELMNYSLDADTEITTAQVPGMNPADVIEYVIKDLAGIQKFNMDTFADEDILNAASLATARSMCAHFSLTSTTFDAGTRGIDIVQDILKIIGGYLYGGKNGSLYLYVYSPSTIPATVLDFEGDETASSKQLIKMDRFMDESAIINTINWTYGDDDTKLSFNDAASVTKYGAKAMDFTTKWNLTNAVSDLEIGSKRLFKRRAEPPPTYKFTISWLMDGDGLEVDLAEVIKLSDPAVNETDKYVEVVAMNIDLVNQTTVVDAEDATALQGKYGICSDEGGTGTTFATDWLNRYCFAANTEPTDPHHDGNVNPGFDLQGNINGVIDDIGVYDDWGNWLESPFIAW